MKFVDEITITVSGGRGGNGCMSFRREKFLPNGGPDGGNGGRGGDVTLVAARNIQTLADFEQRRRFVAGNGEHGSGNSRNGKSGESRRLEVPCGTIVYDAKTGEPLADLVEPGDTYIAAMGGRGGRGNRVFASSKRRAPRFSEKGEFGGEFRLRLELKLIADIGLVGLPNAGKSSILSAVSGASPKIADYPFTTLSPNLGVMFTDIENVILADIPGLIEGASEDKGLGLSFLRHIERTRLLLHVVDISSNDIESIKNDWKIVHGEMEQYDSELNSRPCLIVGNKIDLFTADTDIEACIAALRTYFKDVTPEGYEFIAVSALTGENIEILTDKIIEFSRTHPRPKSDVRLFANLSSKSEADDGSIQLNQGHRNKGKIQIISLPDGSFRVLHPQVEKAAERYDLSQPENVARFTRLLRKYRVEELLIAAGADSGSSVSIGRMEFDFYPDETMQTLSDQDSEEKYADKEQDN